MKSLHLHGYPNITLRTHTNSHINSSFIGENQLKNSDSNQGIPLREDESIDMAILMTEILSKQDSERSKHQVHSSNHEENVLKLSVLIGILERSVKVSVEEENEINEAVKTLKMPNEPIIHVVNVDLVTPVVRVGGPTVSHSYHDGGSNQQKGVIIGNINVLDAPSQHQKHQKNAKGRITGGNPAAGDQLEEFNSLTIEDVDQVVSTFDPDSRDHADGNSVENQQRIIETAASLLKIVELDSSKYRQD